jgi:hypothetical protein
MTQEALKLALEALECANSPNGDYENEITAIKEALAQPKQEPVAWHYPSGSPDQCTTDKAYAEKEPAWTPMYYKHEWVGLTDEDFYGQSELQRLAMRYAEAKLKEKNI